MSVAWKKINERTIRINKWRALKEKRFALPDKHRDNYYVWPGHDIVCTMVVTSRGRVVLAKQFRPGPERIMYELPGGMVDPGENIKAAAMREVREETGYVGDLLYLGRSPHDGWSEAWRSHFLMKNARRVGLPKPDPKEPIKAVTVTISQFLRLVHQGRLSDYETAVRGLMALGKLKGLPKKQ